MVLFISVIAIIVLFIAIRVILGLFIAVAERLPEP